MCKNAMEDKNEGDKTNNNCNNHCTDEEEQEHSQQLQQPPPPPLVVIIANGSSNNNNNNQAEDNTGESSCDAASCSNAAAAANVNMSNATLHPPEYQTIMSLVAHRATSTSTSRDFLITITPPARPPTVILAPPPLYGAPPSYSAIMRIGPHTQQQVVTGPEPAQCRRNVRIRPSPPFIAPYPPPNYAESQGVYTGRSMPATPASTTDSEFLWGTMPVTMICPSCAHVIRTTTYTQRSNLTHFSAIALCICGCWPCCLIPYCMKSCKTTHHYCPDCETHLGMYTPW